MKHDWAGLECKSCGLAVKKPEDIPEADEIGCLMVKLSLSNFNTVDLSPYQRSILRQEVAMAFKKCEVEKEE